MVYKVLIKQSAERELDRLALPLRERIKKHLLSLEDDPRLPGVKKLRGQESYRLRVGDYRVLYTIDDPTHVVTIYAVRHRRQAYR